MQIIPRIVRTKLDIYYFIPYVNKYDIKKNNVVVMNAESLSWTVYIINKGNNNITEHRAIF